MVYVELPMVHADLGDLQLDLDNYRIPTRPDDEAAALRYLFASEDALGAATSILRDGYFDNEVPIVLEDPPESGRFLVLEGNRRVSALKALHDPGLAVGQQSQVERLLKRFAAEVPNLPTRIRVLVAPDRETAAPHIARLHTTTSKKKWTRDQQATFYYSLLDGSTTVSDLKAQYPGVKSIPRFIKMAVMRRFLCGVRFDDPSLHDYAASNDLSMSSFEYAYKTPDIAKVLGVTFTKDGLLEPTTKKPETIGRELAEQHRRAVEYLIGEFRAKHLNTRSAAFKASNPQHQELIDLLTGTSPAPPTMTPPTGPDNDDQRGSSPSSSSAGSRRPSASSSGPGPAGDDAQSPREDIKGSAVRGPNRPETKDKLDLTSLAYSQVPVNLKNRYIELRKLSVKELPITTAVLLRSILETTVKYHLDEKQRRSTMALKDVLGMLKDTEGKNKALLTSLNPIYSGDQDKPGSVAWFNVVAHSQDKPVFPEDVHKAWMLVEPLLRRLLSSGNEGR